VRVAYLINTCPGPYITYIRCEIRAMEALGVSTFRDAPRSGARSSADPEDAIEERITNLRLPADQFRDALRIGLRSDRGILRNLTYLVEAMVLASWRRRENIQHVDAHFSANSAAIAILA
jgi:colanic acid/amylovoran biosynthesis glycosyltransferase